MPNVPAIVDLCPVRALVERDADVAVGVGLLIDGPHQGAHVTFVRDFVADDSSRAVDAFVWINQIYMDGLDRQRPPDALSPVLFSRTSAFAKQRPEMGTDMGGVEWTGWDSSFNQNRLDSHVGLIYDPFEQTQAGSLRVHVRSTRSVLGVEISGIGKRS